MQSDWPTVYRSLEVEFIDCVPSAPSDFILYFWDDTNGVGFSAGTEYAAVLSAEITGAFKYYDSSTAGLYNGASPSPLNLAGYFFFTLPNLAHVPITFNTTLRQPGATGSSIITHAGSETLFGFSKCFPAPSSQL